MKRHSITAIIDRVQGLTLIADRYTKLEVLSSPKNTLIMDKFWRYTDLITKAAVNEIIRLNAEEPLPEIDMEKESEKFLESVKTICEDYNSKILNK
jgi:hypothetical protein